MPPPRLYRLLSPVLCVLSKDDRHVASTVPIDAMLTLPEDWLTTKNRLVDVEWAGQMVMMFAADLRDRVERS